MPTAEKCEEYRNLMWSVINCTKRKIVGWKVIGLLVTIVMSLIGVVAAYSYSCATDTECRVRAVEQTGGETAVKLDALSGDFRDFRTEQRIMNRELMTAIKDLDSKIDTARDK